MKCPKCGKTMRPSKKYPGYYLCDTCRKRYPGSSNKPAPTAKPSTSNKSSRKKSKKRRKSKLPLIIFILVILLAAGFFVIKSGILSSDSEKRAAEPNTVSYSTEETGVLDGIEIKVLSTKTSSGGKVIKPLSGNSFLLIELEVHNTTDTPISISDISNFTGLYENSAIKYSASAYKILSKKQTRLSGTVEPGETFTGFVCYEVPSEFDKIDLEFHYPTWYNQKIAFSITK